MNQAIRYSDSSPPVAEVLNDALDLAPPDAHDPVIEAYKRDVDVTLLRENLKLTPEERSRKFLDFAKFAHELREAGRRARASDSSWGLK